MIKLIDLLNKINERKQVGDLYHFTPLSLLSQIITSHHLIPNDENQVSTSRQPNMITKDFDYMNKVSIARLMLDGDKISNKYKIRPFAFGGDEGSGEELGEEQIIVNSNNFPFLSYLKRIDIFLNKKEKVNNKILDVLNQGNIPYKIYQGTPISNIPYTQPKTGNPEDINIENIPKKEMYSKDEMYFLGMKIKEIELYTSEYNLEINNPSKIKVGISPEYPDYYLYPAFLNNKKYHAFFNMKKMLIPTKYIPIPVYDDPKWRKMWKTNVYPPHNYFQEGDIYDSYILIPKNKIHKI